MKIVLSFLLVIFSIKCVAQDTRITLPKIMPCEVAVRFVNSSKIPPLDKFADKATVNAQQAKYMAQLMSDGQPLNSLRTMIAAEPSFFYDPNRKKYRVEFLQEYTDSITHGAVLKISRGQEKMDEYIGQTPLGIKTQIRRTTSSGCALQVDMPKFRSATIEFQMKPDLARTLNPFLELAYIIKFSDARTFKDASSIKPTLSVPSETLINLDIIPVQVVETLVIDKRNRNVVWRQKGLPTK